MKGRPAAKQKRPSLRHPGKGFFMIEQLDDKVSVADLQSQKDAAEQLGVNTWRVGYLVRSGKLKSVRLPNGSRAIIKSSLEAYRAGGQK